MTIESVAQTENHGAERTWREVPVSASQIGTYRLCARKWGFEKIDGIRSPSTAAASLGDAVHKAIEGWHFGHSLDMTSKAGEIAHRAAPFFVNGADVTIEESFQFRGPNGVLFAGRKDVRILEPREIRDWKTTGNPRYAKTPETLLVDVQATIYAASEFAATAELSSVKLTWVYIPTKTKAPAWPVQITCTREATAERMIAIEETARTIAELTITRPKVLSLLPTPGSCTSFGGCPFVSTCKLSLAEHFGAKPMSNTSLLSMFLAENPMPVVANEDTPSVIDPLDEVIAVNPPEAKYEEPAAIVAPVIEQRTDAAPAPAEAPAAEKPKRGRPKKNPEPVAEAPSLATATEAKIAVLYLNAMPFGAEATYFDMFFSTIENRYFDQTKIEDYRLADFGKGKVEIARLLRESVESGELSGHVVVDIHGDSGRLAAQTLAPFAALIVRGF